ncbi:MAG: hypothetical protein QF819_00320 [Gemmatimonadota bacterium]|jgi:hypothetical protein|nr:hypothetical protein [Gemmatimonadota bacterium]MDP6801608.1 hypothetical protein [Gemmatimonadota bacterium]MDP7030845.1 hypothetical protein [Gemmatimonadota bacterium]
MMIREKDTSILEKDRTNSTYELLLRKAVEEGRVGGDHRCRVCGMKFNNGQAAAECCEKVLQHSKL